MNTKRTPEPWKMVMFSTGNSELDDLGGVWVGVQGQEHIKILPEACDDPKAEARWILSCRKHLQGINPDAVPGLLKAAKAMRPAAMSPDGQVWVDALDTLVAAIAKAEA